ncbi:MAG: alpha-L-rhamnosidase, partial [Verrucomicrobia bacterium]|nr:alpha-L-rhamnosidase [Verrucomicrobiota bacterium]
IWETWKYSDNIYSHNHPMFGSVNEWFYRALLGINTETPGFETVRISPKTVKGLTWAKGSYRSVKGRISVDWKKNGNQLLLNVTVPTGMKAHIYVPHAKGQTIYEGDTKADSVKDISYQGESDGTSIYNVGGGSYRFTVK